MYIIITYTSEFACFVRVHKVYGDMFVKDMKLVLWYFLLLPLCLNFLVTIIVATSKKRWLFGKFGILNILNGRWLFCTMRSIFDFLYKYFKMFVDYCMLYCWLCSCFTQYTCHEWECCSVAWYNCFEFQEMLLIFYAYQNTRKRFQTHFPDHYQIQENEIVI